MRAGARRHLADDGGFAAVFTALVMVAVLAFAAVIVDGGRAYYQSRTMQNAADAAALAGTRALDRSVLFPEVDPATGSPRTADDDAVRRAVNELLQENGASTLEDTPPSTCHLVNPAGTGLTNTCSRAAVRAAVNAQVPGNVATAVSGVYVQAAGREVTFLGGFVNQREVTSRASAIATIQPFLGGTGSPFIICGKVTEANGGNAYPILRPDNTLDFGAVRMNGWETRYDSDGDVLMDRDQRRIPIETSQQKSCLPPGNRQPFKGLMEVGESVNTGNTCLSRFTPENCDWSDITNGNRYLEDVSVVVGGARACTAEDIRTERFECDLLVPVADHGEVNGGTLVLRIVTWVSVHVTPAFSTGCDRRAPGGGGDKFCATINVEVNQLVVSSGITSAGPITDRYTVRAIKLLR